MNILTSIFKSISDQRKIRKQYNRHINLEVQAMQEQDPNSSIKLFIKPITKLVIAIVSVTNSSNRYNIIATIANIFASLAMLKNISPLTNEDDQWEHDIRTHCLKHKRNSDVLYNTVTDKYYYKKAVLFITPDNKSLYGSYCGLNSEMVIKAFPFEPTTFPIHLKNSKADKDGNTKLVLANYKKESAKIYDTYEYDIHDVSFEDTSN